MSSRKMIPDDAAEFAPFVRWACERSAQLSPDAAPALAAAAVERWNYGDRGLAYRRSNPSWERHLVEAGIRAPARMVDQVLSVAVRAWNYQQYRDYAALMTATGGVFVAVELVPGPDCCAAIGAFAGRPLAVGELPPSLPLEGCDQAQCLCWTNLLTRAKAARLAAE